MKYTPITLFWAILIVYPSILFSQITFESGYFIDNDGVKQTCLIKNEDWRNNPTEITLKFDESGTSEIKTISEIKEFGFSSGSLKYIRAEVQIDRSEDVKMRASSQHDPEWSSETLFLKYELEGELSLFSYWDTQVLRYFYKDKETQILQLVNKPYFKKGSTFLQWNHEFRQTLWAKLNCSGEASEKFVGINYDKQSLKKYFLKENECRGSEGKEYNIKRGKNAINLKITPGLKMARLDLKYLPWEPNSVYFDQKVSPRLGLELEYILPFNKDKWAIFAEPTLQLYNSEHQSDTGIYRIDYKSIETPLGFRHYFFLHPEMKVFINVAFTIDISLTETLVKFDGNSTEELKLYPATNIDYGMGLMYANKYSMEIRYNGSRQTRYKTFWDAPYSGFSLILGYKIL